MTTKEKYSNEEKIDCKEFTEELNKLPKREQEKILYIIKGAALTTDVQQHTKNYI